MTFTLHKDDIPGDIDWGDGVAIDTETMGLDPMRDRLCLVQLSNGDGNAHLVQIASTPGDAPNLVALLKNASVTKLFHYARFDVAVLQKTFGVVAAPIYCTKIASKLARTYTDKHGLKDLCRELMQVDLSKQQQSSDWGAAELSKAQLTYAASDVLYLHGLRERLDAMLAREGRDGFAQTCFSFMETRVALDLGGWPDDIFSH